MQPSFWGWDDRKRAVGDAPKRGESGVALLHMYCVAARTVQVHAVLN
jgi:hypothetical protein